MRTLAVFVWAIVLFDLFNAADSFKGFTALRRHAFAVNTVTHPASSTANDVLGFREVSPYWDRSQMPLHTYKAKEPFPAKILSVESLVGPSSTSDVWKVVFDHFGQYHYWEGQCCGVIPPGLNTKNGKPFGNRLYSIASTRYGDDMSGKTVTLCVKRAQPPSNVGDSAPKGVCSNFLCDAKAGDEVLLTGPTGKVMLLPEKSPQSDIIMIATGTGVAPYRAFLRRLLVEKTHAAANFGGFAWLIFGVTNRDSLLFDDEWQQLQNLYPDKFRVTYALSREDKNRDGGKMYVQDRIAESAQEIFARMYQGAHIYFCGLKAMMTDIMSTLERLSVERGLDWPTLLKSWKEEERWHVEVY